MDMHSDSIKPAEVVHNEMSAWLIDAREYPAANEPRRHEIALAAESGPSEANRDSAVLAKAVTMLRDNIDHSLVTAVAEAEQHVTAASFKADIEAKRQTATKARAVAARLAKRGALLDAALNQARQAYHGFQNDLRELATLGAPTPSENLVEVNSRRTLDSAIELLHTKARPLPPLERRLFDELCCGWSRPSERWAAQILDTTVKAKKAF